MSDPELSGEDIMKQNMAAFEAGEDIPHETDMVESSEGLEGDVVGEEPTEDVDNFEGDVDNLEPEEVSELAKKDGYITKEDWVESGKPAEDYMTQAEFEKVGEIRDGKQSRQQIAKQLVQNEALVKEVLDNQRKAIAEAEDRARNETIAKLRAEQKDAIEFGETEKALEIERKVAEHQTPEPAKPQIDDSVQTFFNENKDWYNNHQGARDLLNFELSRSKDKNLPFDDAIGPAMDKVKSQFNYLFDNAPAETPAVERKPDDKPLARPRAISEKSRRPSSAKPSGKKTFNDAPAEMRPMLRKAAKVAKMSESDYMEGYLA